MAGRGGVLVLLALAGCKQVFGLSDPAMVDALGDGPTDTVPVDMRTDTPPGQVCFGTGLLTACYDPAMQPVGTLAFTTNVTVNTDLAVNCDRVMLQSNGPSLCVREAMTVSISGALTTTGARPYVLIAGGSISISGTIRVNAGAQTSTCSETRGANNTSNTASAGAGGGGGGSFGTLGGVGGDGETVGGGTPGAVAALTYIRGGCGGGGGGDSSDGQGGGRGAGGGGLYLIAGNEIVVDGIINASGFGGKGGPNKAGGGGGGSGGLVGLDAPSVTVSATASVYANGGGGGEGGGGGLAGTDGETPSAWDAIPNGGAGNASGGNGGNGFGPTAASAGSSGGNGGGGGGGGAGRIKIYATTKMIGAQVSPPAT